MEDGKQLAAFGWKARGGCEDFDLSWQETNETHVQRASI